MDKSALCRAVGEVQFGRYVATFVAACGKSGLRYRGKARVVNISLWWQRTDAKNGFVFGECQQPCLRMKDSL
jgi:hypothetical protein